MQRLSVSYSFAFTLSSRVISYTTIHTAFEGPGRRPQWWPRGRPGSTTRVIGYDIETRTGGASPPASGSTGASGRSAR